MIYVVAGADSTGTVDYLGAFEDDPATARRVARECEDEHGYQWCKVWSFVPHPGYEAWRADAAERGIIDPRETDDA